MGAFLKARSRWIRSNGPYLEEIGHQFADADAVAWLQHVNVTWSERGFVDEGAVFAAEIAQEVVAVAVDDFGMAARNGIVIDDEGRIGLASDGHYLRLADLRMRPFR